MPVSEKLADLKTINYGGGPNPAISISREQHEKLRSHIQKRLTTGKRLMDTLVERYEEIDREVGGYIKLDEDDKKRDRDNKQGKGPFPTNFNLQLTDAQMDEAATYIATVLAPEEGMYGATARKDQQPTAKAFTVLMNKHGNQFQHYRHLCKGINDSLKYNLGGWIPEWTEIRGNRVVNDTTGASPNNIETNQVIADGNTLTPIDPYNTMWDPSVHPLEVPTKAEFFATIDTWNSLKLLRAAENEQIFGAERFISRDSNMNPNFTYYKPKPDIRSEHDSKEHANDFHHILSMGDHKDVAENWEIVTYYGWINPSWWGIGPDDSFQIWRITLIGDSYIIDMEHLNNAHAMLPLFITMPKEDGMDLQTRSYAEKLSPLQKFASHELNVHQRIARKALYRTTYYDKMAIPDFDDRALEGGAIPVAITGADKDVRKSVFVVDDLPMSRDTMKNIEDIGGLMDKLLPANMLQQVAGLERATQYQAAATVQSGNRRNLKLAKIINDQAWGPMKNAQMYNIFQFQGSLDTVDPDTQEDITINPNEFRDAGIEFTISDGLKGIDKLILIEGLKEVINMMLQSPTMSQEVDMLGIIDYWLSLVGDRTDLKQFKFCTSNRWITSRTKRYGNAIIADGSSATGGWGCWCNTGCATTTSGGCIMAIPIRLSMDESILLFDAASNKALKDILRKEIGECRNRIIVLTYGNDAHQFVLEHQIIQARMTALEELLNLLNATVEHIQQNQGA